MKTRIFIPLVLLSAYFLTSCKQDEIVYYSELGNIRIANDSAIIETDAGDRLLVHNPESISPTVANNDRVLVDFSLVEGTAPAGIDYVIDIINLMEVLVKPVIVITPENADSIGNDPITVSNLWLEKNYLNLSFTFFGGEQGHIINLVRNPGEIPVDTVDLEIRHNEHNDNGTYYYISLVSFDLTSLQNEVADSVILSVKAYEGDSRTFQKFITYKF